MLRLFHALTWQLVNRRRLGLIPQTEAKHGAVKELNEPKSGEMELKEAVKGKMELKEAVKGEMELKEAVKGEMPAFNEEKQLKEPPHKNQELNQPILKERDLKQPILKGQALKQPILTMNEVQQSLDKAKEEPKPDESKLSERYLKFREKLRSEAPLTCLPKGAPHPAHEKDPLVPWPNNTNPYTGEVGGPAGPEPTRYGDWERKGRVTDF
ncbi:DNA ligase 1 [Drosophila miranda]|uniref:DNA ligase 1 n=1 Tax=Drosophila miranda TaxID=7229 RepID=UPI0007E6F825|nr:DNA ligase 1 [Drosophila miranda]